jgi:hypothetical protein
VSNLSAIRGVSDGIHAPVPIDLLQHRVEVGRSPDEFTAEQLRQAEQSSDGVRSKQEAFRQLEAMIRQQAGDILAAESRQQQPQAPEKKQKR